MGILPESHRDLIILDHHDQDPDSTQASLADLLGVAVGTVNWHLKRLIEKGYLKARRIERRKLRYIITPEGIALRARLTVDYIQSNFNLYRLARGRAESCIHELRELGLNSVQIIGSGDVAEICRLTCLEMGVTVREEGGWPLLRIVDLKIFLELEAPKHTDGTE
jgi:DNA-binding MarR family transcriptional regulator